MLYEQQSYTYVTQGSTEDDQLQFRHATARGCCRRGQDLQCAIHNTMLPGLGAGILRMPCVTLVKFPGCERAQQRRIDSDLLSLPDNVSGEFRISYRSSQTGNKNIWLHLLRTDASRNRLDREMRRRVILRSGRLLQHTISERAFCFST
jgi:hypothetical protein